MAEIWWNDLIWNVIQKRKNWNDIKKKKQLKLILN